MACARLSHEDLRALRKHGHPNFWEVAIYGKASRPDSVTVECTKCGEVLIELVSLDLERQNRELLRYLRESGKRMAKDFFPDAVKR